jgi:hypothetical protein
MTQSKYYAVLTGDIIKSSRLSPADLESVRTTLLRAVNAVRRWKPGLIQGKPEFFRGDAWQLLLTDPAPALRVAIHLRASLRAAGLADTRVAIGLGPVEKISSERVSLSTGQVFVLSGKALDQMTRYSSMTIEVPKPASPLAEWLQVAGHLCDSLIGQWTMRQAELVRAAVNPKEPDSGEIGQSLKPVVSKQAVAKGLSAANWYVVREAIRLFEETSWGTVLRREAQTTENGCLPPDNQKRLSAPRQPKKVV